MEEVNKYLKSFTSFVFTLYLRRTVAVSSDVSPVLYINVHVKDRLVLLIPLQNI
jgi:hypothetical protein